MLFVQEYLPMRAGLYARRWALSRNPLFNDYSRFGGDCTNFVSQCILAGAPVMNFTPTFGWYYRSDSDRAPAWTGVEPFYRFLTENEGEGPFGTEIAETDARAGDVVQLGREGESFYHTLFVLERTEEEIFVAAHTDDAIMRPLSSYVYGTARFLRVLGVRVTLPDNAPVFYGLLEGRALPPSPLYTLASAPAAEMT